MKKKVVSEFPDTIYVVSVEPEKPDASYLIASKTPEDADPDESDTGNVAVYGLEHVGKRVVTIS